MADIFLSYAREDRDRARTIAESLEEQGWSVFWDKDISAGHQWRNRLEAELGNARCVVVLWSHDSINSDWVKAEARTGGSRGVLVPVIIDEVEPPEVFGNVQAAHLAPWDGRPSAPEMGTVVSAVAGRLGGSSAQHWLKDLLFYQSDRSLSLLLGFLLIQLFVVYPLAQEVGLSHTAVDVFTWLVMISGMYSIERRRYRYIGLVLVVINLATWAPSAIGFPVLMLHMVSRLSFLVFLVFASVVILTRVFATGPVNIHRIQGAIVVYLLIGLGFGIVYELLELWRPGSFGGSLSAYSVFSMSHLSFSILTTVGYGDVMPLLPIAKQMAVLEGLIGQLYPPILLVRLVWMQLAGRSD